MAETEVASVPVGEEAEAVAAPKAVHGGVLPVPRVDRIVRKRFGSRRCSPGVAVYTTAALENVFAEIVRSAKAEAVASKKKRIAKENLVRAVRTHPGLSRFFRSYAFSTGTRLPYKSAELLTKTDREAAEKKREEMKAKKAAAAVPGVDEA